MKTSRLALQSRRVTASTVALVAAFVVPFLAHGDLVRGIIFVAGTRAAVAY